MTEQIIDSTKYVLEKDGSPRLSVWGATIDIDDPSRFKFYYNEDGSYTSDPDLEGSHNIFGELHSQVYGYNENDWANPYGDYASYGSFGAEYT